VKVLEIAFVHGIAIVLTTLYCWLTNLPVPIVITMNLLNYLLTF